MDSFDPDDERSVREDLTDEIICTIDPDDAKDYDDAISLTSYLIGLGKAPVFAIIIALVGCYQGFQVTGSADSVGRQTTVSVVQSIFLVIVTDALFSIVFSWLRI